MTISFESLGLYPERYATLRSLPGIVLYGPSGAGKSLESYVAFQDALVIKTSETVTRPYYAWVRDQDRPLFDKSWQAFAETNSAHTSHPLFKASADEYALAVVGKETGWRPKLHEITVPSTVNNWAWFTWFKDMMKAAKLAGHVLPFSGPVHDEFTEVLRRVFFEMQHSGMFMSKKKANVVDDWAVMDALEAWVMDYCETFRSIGVLNVMVCQEAPVSFEEGTTIVKYKCGPATPFGRLRKVLCEAPDICLRITIEEPSTLGALSALLAAGQATGQALSPQHQTTAAQAQQSLQGQQTSQAQPAGALAAFVAQAKQPVVQPPQPVQPPTSLAEEKTKHYVKRYYWTEVHPLCWTKFRDTSISYKENLGLRKLLERSNYL